MTTKATYSKVVEAFQICPKTTTTTTTTTVTVTYYCPPNHPKGKVTTTTTKTTTTTVTVTYYCPPNHPKGKVTTTTTATNPSEHADPSNKQYKKTTLNKEAT
jgi:hypothetical protein